MRNSFILLLLIVLLSACSQEPKTRLVETTLLEQYGDLLSEIDYITVRQSNGDLTEITNPGIVHQWLQNVSRLPLAIDQQHEGSVGFLYSINLYKDNELKAQFSTEIINEYWLLPNEALVHAINTLLIN